MSSDTASRFRLGDAIGHMVSRPLGNLFFLARMSWVSFVIFLIAAGAFFATLVTVMVPFFNSLPADASEAEITEALTAIILQNGGMFMIASYGLMAAYIFAIVPPYVSWIRFSITGTKPKGFFHFSLGMDERRVLLYMIVVMAVTIVIGYAINFLGSKIGIAPTKVEAMSLGLNVYSAYPFGVFVALAVFVVQMCLYARWLLAPVIIIDNSSGDLGMVRSWSVTKGVAFKLTVLIVLSVIVIYAAVFLITLVPLFVGTFILGILSVTTGIMSNSMMMVFGFGVAGLIAFFIGLMGYGYIVGVMGSVSVEAYKSLVGRPDVAEVFD